MSETKAPSGKSGLAIAGLVVGIVALLGSWMPILNNLAFFIALIGLVLSIVALVKVAKAGAGKGLALAATIINVLAVVVVLATQSMYSAAIDEATSGTSVATSQQAQEQTADDGADSGDATAAADYSKVKVGTKVTLENGLVVCVKSVKTGLINYDGSKVTQVTVTYKNSSSEKVSYNSYDWKAENSKGSQNDTTYYDKEQDELSYGKLKAGGSVTGNVYFKGAPVRIVYDPTSFGENQDIGWVVK